MRRIGVALAAAGLLVGCTSQPLATPHTAPPTHVASHVASPGPDTPAGKHAIRATVDTVRDYLDVWAAQGPARATRFLYPRWHPTSDQGMPKLVSGSVESYSVRDWHGPTRFTLMVDLDLAFDGSPYSWNRGQNTRFVTPHRQASDGRYLLEFNSSP